MGKQFHTRSGTGGFIKENQIHTTNTKINLLTSKYALYNLEYVNNSSLCEYWGFPGGSEVKNLPAIQESQESQVQSMGWEDPLEKNMVPTPVSLPGEFHGQRSLASYSPLGHKESDTTEAT